MSGRGRLRLVTPFERRTGLGEIEREQDIGVGRDDVHRIVDDQWRAFVASDYTGGEGESHLQVLHRVTVDFRKFAEAP